MTAEVDKHCRRPGPVPMTPRTKRKATLLDSNSWNWPMARHSHTKFSSLPLYLAMENTNPKGRNLEFLALLLAYLLSISFQRFRVGSTIRVLYILATPLPFLGQLILGMLPRLSVKNQASEPRSALVHQAGLLQPRYVFQRRVMVHEEGGKEKKFYRPKKVAST